MYSMKDKEGLSQSHKVFIKILIPNFSSFVLSCEKYPDDMASIKGYSQQKLEDQKG